MRQIFALACIAAGLSAMSQTAAAAALGDRCESFLIGGWKLDTDGDPVTIVFGGGGQMKKETLEGEERATWTVANMPATETCEITVVGESGKDEQITVSIVDVDTIGIMNKTYRREDYSKQAYGDDVTAALNADCPTYFIGSWIRRTKSRVTRAVFNADGSYSAVEAVTGKPFPETPDVEGSWRATASPRGGSCKIFLAAKDGREDSLEVILLGANSFKDPKSKQTFVRE